MHTCPPAHKPRKSFVSTSESSYCESILRAALPLPLESYSLCCNITMSLLTGCLTVLLVGTLVSNVSALPLNNCTARYQAALDEVLTIKEQCKGAAFYDCCQVRSTSRVKRHRESKLVPRILIQLQNILSFSSYCYMYIYSHSLVPRPIWKMAWYLLFMHMPTFQEFWIISCYFCVL